MQQFAQPCPFQLILHKEKLGKKKLIFSKISTEFFF